MNCASTDVNNLVNTHSIQCQSQVQTDEKDTNAIIEMSDMSAQIERDMKEASCGANNSNAILRVESRASQSICED
jgi:hypothetical protein